MGGQKETGVKALKFHNVLMGGPGVQNGGQVKEKRKRKKKAGLLIQHDEPQREKKRKKKTHNKEEINIPIDDNNVPLDLSIKKSYTEEDNFYTDVEPSVSFVQSNEECPLPLDLSQRRILDTEDDEQQFLLREPPPLVPINKSGNGSYFAEERRYENITNVSNNNENMYYADKPQGPRIVVKENTPCEAQQMSTIETGSANTVVFNEEKVVRKCFFVEVKLQSQLALSLPVLNVIQNKALSPSLAPEIVHNKKSGNSQKNKFKDTSASSLMVQTRETAAGNVGVFRTFRNLKKFESHRKDTSLRKKSTKSNNREKIT